MVSGRIYLMGSHQPYGDNKSLLDAASRIALLAIVAGAGVPHNDDDAHAANVSYFTSSARPALLCNCKSSAVDLSNKVLFETTCYTITMVLRQ